jgi:urease accessory protein
MAGIGLWSARQNGHARWLIPGSFLALMAIAAWFGTVGPTFTEQGIAASVFLIGLLVSFRVSFSAKTSALTGMLIAGVFALFHGFARGTEIPDSTGAWQFASGFLLTTITLQAIGFFVRRALTKNEKPLRIGGAAIAASGGLLAFQGLH